MLNQSRERDPIPASGVVVKDHEDTLRLCEKRSVLAAVADEVEELLCRTGLLLALGSVELGPGVSVLSCLRFHAFPLVGCWTLDCVREPSLKVESPKTLDVKTIC